MEYLTIRQVAEQYNISYSTARAYINKLGIPTIARKQTFYINKKDLAVFEKISFGEKGKKNEIKPLKKCSLPFFSPSWWLKEEDIYPLCLLDID